jgi:excisionase family DNA binding protein
MTTCSLLEVAELAPVEVAEGLSDLQPAGSSMGLPFRTSRCAQHVAELLARGGSVSVVPVNRDLSTQEAAALLKVSRQYVVRLAARGNLPFLWVGALRKVRLADVLAFKERREEERRRHWVAVPAVMLISVVRAHRAHCGRGRGKLSLDSSQIV